MNLFILAGRLEKAVTIYIQNLVNWCSNNNLSFNVNKTKKIVIDFRKRKGEHVPVYINGDEVERVE